MTALGKIISPESPNEILEGARVLALEAEALHRLAQTLPPFFSKAIQLILECTGRVVVTGMGKSGLIARKIAATLSSTGTPSFFVHPAEASHGDLGMIQNGDLLIALSASGETSELSDVIAYASRRQIPLIGITFNEKSALAEMSTHALILPQVEEACPLGLAPTTSTTVMMALGDALAVCLLKRRGFTSRDFGDLHPRGMLGQRLMRVEQLMHQGKDMPIARKDLLMKDVLLIMTRCRLGCVGIVDEQGFLKGIITDGDLRRHMSDHLLTEPAHKIMTRDPLTISPHLLAQEALAIINRKGITNLFVADSRKEGNVPLGVIHVHDMLRANIS